LSGAGTFTLGMKKFTIKKGDFIHVPKGTIHAVDVTSSNPLKVISVQSPEFLGQDRVYVN